MSSLSPYAPYSWLGNLYQLNQRVYVPFNYTLTAPMGVLLTAQETPYTISVLATQAIRWVKTSVVICLDPNGSGQLSCEALQIFIEDSTGNQVMAFPGVYSGSVMGGTGVAATMQTDEVLLPNDYQTLGGDGKTFYVNIGADVLNRDAANDHDFRLLGGVLYEVWQQPTSIAHVGYP